MNYTAKISLFKHLGCSDPIEITFQELIKAIKTGSINGQDYKGLIQQIKQTENKAERESLKQKLPAVTISAICKGGRKKDNIVQHTGFMQIDLDDQPRLLSLRKELEKETYVYLLFLSPSGKGLKMICKTPDKNHEPVYKALAKYIRAKFELDVDEKVKDTARLCFCSFDPEIYVNEQAEQFQMPELDEPHITIIKKQVITEKKREQYYHDVDSIIQLIEEKKADITGDYDEWLKIGFALADTFGPEGNTLYHRISRFYHLYNSSDCEKQYQKCLNSNGEGITIKTFFQIAKNHGYTKPYNSPIPWPDKRETFYKPVLDREGNWKDISIVYPKWMDILYNLGFRRYDVGLDHIFIRIDNQVVREVSITGIQDAFIDYLKDLPERLLYGITPEVIISKFYKNPSHYFCDARLTLLKPQESLEFNKDSQGTGYLFFNNGYVLCQPGQYEMLPYQTLKGLIWHDRMVKRTFVEDNLKNKGPEERGIFSKFIFNISGKNLERYHALCSMLGYLLHGYYDCKLKAIILTDERISEAPSGRTGKTLLCKALGYITKYTEINGKDFKADNKHKYQQADIDTQVIHLNDVNRNFDFETLFNDITDNIVVDKKNMKPFTINAKVVVSTNKTIRIEGASAKDRAVEFELADYYHDKFSPENEFGHWFFRDWDEVEWNRFYNFCCCCLSSYLEHGITVVPNLNLNKRKLLECTSSEFEEFMLDSFSSNLIVTNVDYNKKALYDRFISEYPEMTESKAINQRKFTKWLHIFALHSDLCGPIDPAKHERKSGSDRYIQFPERI